MNGKATATAHAREKEVVHHGHAAFIGEVLGYRVTNEQVDRMNGLRIVSRSMDTARLEGKFPQGAQAHIGAASAEGDILPLIVTRITEGANGRTLVNGQLILDGSDSLWIEHATEGDGPGQWQARE